MNWKLWTRILITFAAIIGQAVIMAKIFTPLMGNSAMFVTIPIGMLTGALLGYWTVQAHFQEGEGE